MKRMLGVILCCVVLSQAFASETQRVRNEEYRFSVTLPAANGICTALSGDHPHGFYVRFGAGDTSCHAESDAGISAISVDAYGNSTFERTPEEEIAGLCPKGSMHQRQPYVDLLKGLAFRGHHSATCATESADGSIDIYVVTQAGEWPQPHDSPEFAAPFVNYTASLHTHPSRIGQDLEIFRTVLSSVQIEYPK